MTIFPVVINLVGMPLKTSEASIVIAPPLDFVFDNDSALKKADEIYRDFLTLAGDLKRRETTITVFTRPEPFHFGIYLRLVRLLECGYPRLVVMQGDKEHDLEEFVGPSNKWTMEFLTWRR